ncbi:MAG TPA: RNA polymerase sigma factor [Candidatus Limnocylindrales bacterium]|nr:RNA polymerase sigma factor [Candidatus Limnocylindrales bacterium]
MERAIAGDREAFSELVRRSIDRLYAVARLILRDAGRAEDATQEALVLAWRDLSSLRDPDRFEAWLHRVLVRACYREARRDRDTRRSVVRQLESSAPFDRHAPDSSLGLAERDALERGFRRLDTDERTLLVLHYYLGYSISEVAATLGVPAGTAKSRLNRATAAMRAALEADARLPLRNGASA